MAACLVPTLLKLFLAVHNAVCGLNLVTWCLKVTLFASQHCCSRINVMVNLSFPDYDYFKSKSSSCVVNLWSCIIYYTFYKMKFQITSALNRS